MTPNISFNPNVQYEFSYTVEYGIYSANISNRYTSAEAAQAAGLQEAIRLASHDTEVKRLEISAYCPECSGRGTITTRSGKRVLRVKESKCPSCKGKHSTVVILGE